MFLNYSLRDGNPKEILIQPFFFTNHSNNSSCIFSIETPLIHMFSSRSTNSLGQLIYDSSPALGINSNILALSPSGRDCYHLETDPMTISGHQTTDRCNCRTIIILLANCWLSFCTFVLFRLGGRLYIMTGFHVHPPRADDPLIAHRYRRQNPDTVIYLFATNYYYS